MNMFAKKLLVCVVVVAGALLGSVGSVAADFPAKPIRLVVPFSAGGATDLFARTVAAVMTEQMGTTVFVENRPGASSIIGTTMAARAPADGYTLLLGDSSTFAVNPSMYTKLSYDPIKDFIPLTLSSKIELLLVVNPDLVKARNLREFIQEAAEGGKITSYASVGIGSTHHLAMELLKQKLGLKLQHVPYKGAAPAVQDLLGGQIPVMFVNSASAGPMIKTGKIRVIATAAGRRSPQFPDVATIAEQGIPGFDVWAWQALAVPAGTPAAIISQLQKAYQRAVATDQVRLKLEAAGIESSLTGSAEATDFIKKETKIWAQVIRSGNIRAEE